MTVDNKIITSEIPQTNWEEALLEKEKFWGAYLCKITANGKSVYATTICLTGAPYVFDHLNVLLAYQYDRFWYSRLVSGEMRTFARLEERFATLNFNELATLNGREAYSQLGTIPGYEANVSKFVGFAYENVNLSVGWRNGALPIDEFTKNLSQELNWRIEPLKRSGLVLL